MHDASLHEDAGGAFLQRIGQTARHQSVEVWSRSDASSLDGVGCRIASHFLNVKSA
jgi:hypothetical protein